MTATAAREAKQLVPRRCTKCGVVGTGQFCSACGEDLGRPRDLSFKHFMKEAFVAVTDVDSALIASFRSLLTRPGELTREYLTGDRQRFMAPFRVFLLCNLVYFIAVAQYGVGVFTAPFRVQVEQIGYRNVARMMVNERLHTEAPAMSLEQAATRDSVKQAFAARYDGATEGIGKAIVFVLIPLYALVFQVLYWRERRYFAEHLVLSTHLLAFLLLVIAVMGVVLRLVGGMMHHLTIGSTEGQSDELLTGTFLIAVFSAYTYMAQRAVYAPSRLGAGLRTLVVAATVIPMTVLFKFVLFLVTLYWIR